MPLTNQQYLPGDGFCYFQAMNCFGWLLATTLAYLM
jgi:hypothetical protein